MMTTTNNSSSELPNATLCGSPLLLSDLLAVTPDIQNSAALIRTPVNTDHLPPSSFSVSELLADAFSLVNRAPWLHDFLFESNVSADVAMLSSPVPLSFACTADVSDTSIEESGMHSGALDKTIKARWALVPSFCAQNITCGVAVTAFRTSTAHNSSLCRGTGNGTRKNIGRFLRDESTAEFVLFQNDPAGEDGPECNIIHMKHVNSTTRRRICLRFRKPLLGAPMASSVLTACATLDSHWCRQCNQSPNAMCACVLQFTIPRHPLDYTSGVNMVSHAGTFMGKSSCRMFSGPLAGKSAEMRSNCNVIGGCDSALVKRLATWAIQDRLATLGPLSLLRDLTKNPPDDFSFSMSSFSPSCTTLKTRPAFDMAIAGSDDVQTFSKTQSALSNELPVPHHVSSVSPLCSTLDTLSVQSVDASLDLGFLGLSEFPSTSNEFGPESTAFSSMPFATDTGSSKLPAILTDGTSFPNITGIASRSVPLTQIGEDVSKEEAERMERKHRRKLRNREAAARSNKKRKENYENLQKNVFDIRRRKEVLTKRLHDLRAENAALKAKTPGLTCRTGSAVSE